MEFAEAREGRGHTEGSLPGAVEPRDWTARSMRRALATVARAIAYPELAVHRTVLPSVAAVLVLSNLIGAPLFRVLRPQGGIHSVPGFLVAALSLELTLVGFVALAAVLRRGGAARSVPTARRRWPELVALGLLAGPLLFLVSAIVQLALASTLGVRQTQIADFLWIRRLDLGQFGLLLAIVAVLAPFAEEAFFRGYVFRAYLEARGWLWAYPLSAALFALLHTNLPAAAPIFAMGLVLAWVYDRTRSIVPCAIAHGFNNAVSFVAVYAAPVQHLG